MAVTLQKGKYFSDVVLSLMHGTAAPAAPATLYVALLTTMPTKADGTGMIEVTGGSYARATYTNAGGWTANSTAGDNVTEQSSNVNIIAWPSPTAGWGNIVGIAILDAASGGNIWKYGDFQNAGVATVFTIAAGNTFVIPVGDLLDAEN